MSPKSQAIHFGMPFIKLLPIALISLLAWGCSSESNTLTPQQKQLRQGRELFSRSCSSCHGKAGGGLGGRGGPSLKREQLTYGNSQEALYTSIQDGRENGMPAFGESYNEAQIEALVAYVLYLRQ